MAEPLTILASFVKFANQAQTPATPARKSHLARNIGIIAIILVLLIASLVGYSYTQVKGEITNASIAGVDLAPISAGTALKLGASVLTGDVIGAMLALVNTVKLDLNLALTNNGILPVYIPSESHSLYINGIYVGNGTDSIDTAIAPGQTIDTTVHQDIQLNTLSQVVESIVQQSGNINVAVNANAHFSILGLPINVPIKFTKQISLVDILKQKVTSALKGGEQSSPIQVSEAYFTLGGNTVTSAPDGSDVTAAVVVQSVDQSWSGSATVQVRKDRVGLPDSTVAEQTFEVSLGAGQSKTLEVDFTVQSGTLVRGYFIKATWDSAQWQQEEAYPPRLSVSGYVAATSTQIINSTTATTSFTVQQTGTTIVNGQYKVGPGRYLTFQFTLPQDAQVTGSFSAEAGLGDNIIVYIFDQSQYSQYQNNPESPQSSYYYSGKVGSDSFAIALNAGTYYIVLDNTYSTLSTKTVTIQAMYG